MFGRFTFNASNVPEHEMNQSLYCTSTAKDIELITIDQANTLCHRIKDYSPDTEVITSFAPFREADFERVGELPGDAIEINTRLFPITAEKPYIAAVYFKKDFDERKLEPTGSLYWEEELKRRTPAELLRDCVERNQQFEEDKKRKIAFFRKGFEKLRANKQVLLKLSRQYWEMDKSEYLDLPADGFTYSDSTKNALTTSISGVQVDLFGKGSICGKVLQEETVIHMKFLRDRVGDAYLSASGGIVDGSSAVEAIENGADSVQICTAVYLGGYDLLRGIVDAVKTGHLVKRK